MFVCQTDHDPLLARSDRRIRFAAIIPTIGLGTIEVTARLVSPTRGEFVLAMLSLGAAGQVLTWWGMRGVQQTRGWLSGVVSYIWLGAVINCWALAFTGVFIVLPALAIAPLVATVARWRMGRAAARGGEEG